MESFIKIPDGLVVGAWYELTAPVENPCARRKGDSPLLCSRVLPAGLRFTVSKYGLRDEHEELLFSTMRYYDGLIEKVIAAAVKVSPTLKEEYRGRVWGMCSRDVGFAMYQAALQSGLEKDALWRKFSRQDADF